MKTGAALSPCRTYRYALWRRWSASLDASDCAVFIGLNPSTADETKDDPTIRRCIAFAKAWGHGGLYMLNLFALRATDPAEMKRHPNPIGPENIDWIMQVSLDAAIVVAAWGTHGRHLHRDVVVRNLVPNLHVLRLTKDGFPGHPLYLPKHLTPTPWIK